MEDLALTNFTLMLLVGLVVKHFIADYMLQTAGMIEGKGSLLSSGGYLHAGIHAVGTIIVFALFAIPTTLFWILVVTEFVVHYLIDFAKQKLGDQVKSNENPRMFWMINGFDQLLHHLTYIALAMLIVHNL